MTRKRENSDAAAQEESLVRGVVEACVGLAGGASARPVRYGRFRADVLKKVLAAQALDGPGATESLRMSLRVFEAVARDLAGWLHLFGGKHSSAWREVADSLRQCGIDCDAADTGRPSPGNRALGRPLGSVLVRLNQACEHQGGIRVAEHVFDGCARGEARQVFAEAVQVPEAGALATLGCIACGEGWLREFAGWRFTPAAVAWMLDGLRLDMPADMRTGFASLKRSEPGLFDKMHADMLASVREWNEDELVEFTQARASVLQAVGSFNASARRDWVVDGKAVAVAHRLTPAILQEVETTLAMKRSSRRLAGGDRAERDGRSRRRA